MTRVGVVHKNKIRVSATWLIEDEKVVYVKQSKGLCVCVCVCVSVYITIISKTESSMDGGFCGYLCMCV